MMVTDCLDRGLGRERLCCSRNLRRRCSLAPLGRLLAAPVLTRGSLRRTHSGRSSVSGSLRRKGCGQSRVRAFDSRQSRRYRRCSLAPLGRLLAASVWSRGSLRRKRSGRSSVSGSLRRKGCGQSRARAFRGSWGLVVTERASGGRTTSRALTALARSCVGAARRRYRAKPPAAPKGGGEHGRHALAMRPHRSRVKGARPRAVNYD